MFSYMDYNSRKLFGYNTGAVYIPQKTIRKMRNLPPYIRTVKGKGKRKSCRRCKRTRLRGGRRMTNEETLDKMFGINPKIFTSSYWRKMRSY